MFPSSSHVGSFNRRGKRPRTPTQSIPKGRERSSCCSWTSLIIFFLISQQTSLTIPGTVDALLVATTPTPRSLAPFHRHARFSHLIFARHSVKLSSVATNAEAESTTINQPCSPASLPYQMELMEAEQRKGRSRPFNTLIVRHLEDDDLPEVVRMCVQAFGPSNPQNNPLVRIGRILDYAIQQLPLPNNLNRPTGLTSRQNRFSELGDIPEFAEYALNYVMAWVLYLALVSRIRWRMWGEENSRENPELEPDHHVLCLADQDTNQVIGIAEVSYQLPYQTAPAYVLPLSWKKLLSRFIYFFNLPADEDASMSDALVMPYVSSVVVKDAYRGFGYGSVLMQAVERHAKHVLKCDEVTLHVDANKGTTEAAQSLYSQMGYRPIQDERKGIVSWLTDYDNTRTGIYFCDGTQMLYMKKQLCD